MVYSYLSVAMSAYDSMASKPLAARVSNVIVMAALQIIKNSSSRFRQNDVTAHKTKNSTAVC
jgi:hypothetical protein